MGVIAFSQRLRITWAFVNPSYGARHVFLSLRGGGSFDFDFPEFLWQAGRNHIDIMLQPSWTWSCPAIPLAVPPRQETILALCRVARVTWDSDITIRDRNVMSAC